MPTMPDWKARFNAPQIAYAAIAVRNPGRGVVVASMYAKGTPGLYAWNRSADAVRLLVAEAGFGGIAPDGEYIYYFDDDAGMYQRVAFAGGTPEPIAPDLAPYHSDSISQSIDGRWLGFTASAGKKSAAYRMALGKEDDKPGERTTLYTTDSPLLGPLFSADGTIAVIATTDRGNGVDFALLAFAMDTESGSARVLQESDGSLLPVAFAPVPGDARLLAMTDVTGVIRPVLWDTSTGDRIDLPLEDIEGDISAWGWSADATQILLYRLHRAHSYLYVYDLARSTFSQVNTPTGTLYNGFFDADGQIIVTHADHAHPAHLLKLAATGIDAPQPVLSLSDATTRHNWRSVDFPSKGGISIQAWLATPDPAQFGEGPYPLMIEAHDGPFDVTTDTWKPEASAWLDHGIAWMSVNYRGSVSFGREHQLSIIGIPGHREVDDLTWALRYCVENRIAHEDKIILSGEGYGGYLVLQALGRYPDLWLTGIATAPLADLTTALPDLPEALREFYLALMSTTPQERPELYRASSPITYVDSVIAPLMLCLPNQDPRCPDAQISAYVQRLQKRDVNVQTMRYAMSDEQTVPMEQRLLWAHQHLQTAR